jgi:UDP-GlcNAc:undecaprenyl-phosphate GlcNAc-1-phosphate transferase
LKATIQLLAAGIVIADGVAISRVSFNGTVHDLGILSVPATLVWIVALTNAFNLVDGLDGLASGLAIIAGMVCSVVLLQNSDVGALLLLASLLGALSGFLVFNFNPASIFLGDGGSLFTGYVLSVVAVTTWQTDESGGIAGVPLLAFSLPMIDTILSIVRRLAGGGIHRIVEPDRSHIHHKLLAGGWSQRGAVLLLYAVSASVSLAAMLSRSD